MARPIEGRTGKTARINIRVEQADKDTLIAQAAMDGVKESYVVVTALRQYTGTCDRREKIAESMACQRIEATGPPIEIVPPPCGPLDADVWAAVDAIAARRGMTSADVVNAVLRESTAVAHELLMQGGPGMVWG